MPGTNPQREKLDLEQFDLGIKKAAEYQADDLKTHFIVAGNYYFWYAQRDRMVSIILNKMKKYGIKEAMVTIIQMTRWYLITKEKMEDYYKGKEKQNGLDKKSVHDDLDSFFDKLQNGWWGEEEVGTYFIPKLTEKEKKLVEEKDKDHLMSYFDGRFGGDPDVSKKEMDESESKSKFVRGSCERWTFILNTKKGTNKRIRKPNIGSLGRNYLLTTYE